MCVCWKLTNHAQEAVDVCLIKSNAIYQLDRHLMILICHPFVNLERSATSLIFIIIWILDSHLIRHRCFISLFFRFVWMDIRSIVCLFSSFVDRINFFFVISTFTGNSCSSLLLLIVNSFCAFWITTKKIEQTTSVDRICLQLRHYRALNLLGRQWPGLVLLGLEVMIKNQGPISEKKILWKNLMRFILHKCEKDAKVDRYTLLGGYRYLPHLRHFRTLNIK